MAAQGWDVDLDMNVLQSFDSVDNCKEFVHIPDEKRQKLDAKSLECVLVGWSESKQAYRLLQRSSGHILESRDVVFNKELPDELPHHVTRCPTAPALDSTVDVKGRNRNSDAGADTGDAKAGDILGQVGDGHANHATALRDDPQTYKEAMSRPDADMWKAACAEELLAFAKAELYDGVECPQNRKVVGCKWMFHIKRGAGGSIKWGKKRGVREGEQIAAERSEVAICD
ncbi:hypothetical protein ONZ51_g12792 [Trametes cubensis]|uniref:Retroviral polymerase SH3-like domain-containing protein n=1 Tax=Trametes cubensis TaxID=1111947 RepID=A0AAD7TF56_9APHY|nr:hypothetical protein ONZ51_g12792 [Trametes cubensis]